MSNKNKEGYPDPTASKAIHTADRQPERIEWLIRVLKSLAELMDCEIAGRIVIRGQEKQA